MKENLISFLKNPVTLFLSKALLFYIIWDLLMVYYLNTSSLNDWLSGHVTSTSIAILDMIGYAVRGYDRVHGINIDGRACVFLGHACNGLDFMGVFLCFVLAYPANWIHKLWFIPLGILAIHGLNIIRVVLLAMNMQHFADYFEFNHKYTFIIIVYALIFWLWTTWIKRYGYSSKSSY